MDVTDSDGPVTNGSSKEEIEWGKYVHHVLVIPIFVFLAIDE